MKGLKDEKRKATYHLGLALAIRGKLIWSTEKISDRGLIAEKLIDKEIPLYRWMGHLWYYPKFNKVFNMLSKEEKEKIRKQAVGIKRGLRKVIKEILEKNKKLVLRD